MGDSQEKGKFQADIPDDAVSEALRSVERVAREGAGEEEPAVEVDPSDASDPAAEAARLKLELELSQALGRESQKKLEDLHDRWLRAVADLENYKKRAQKERDDVQKFGVEKVVKDLLPVLDNLDRALAAAAADDPLVDGVKLVRASFEQALGRHGVKPFSALGQPFDPARHEALLQVPSADAAPGTVVLEHARGFTLHERLLRPARVGVAVAPAPKTDGEGGGA
ncbi:MAG TPA: nucleotide exchange factor GrpE [Anaeromyxobacteraceae bacterium]|nr:nucleotide exchange factor GrpE [Anaeromyxobacteraceae bacterium]